MGSLIGSRIDKYDMLAEVGHGGMAVVYRGRDTVLDREVAVKVLHPHLADRQESRLRLQREAIAVAKLRHDNILEIFDYSGPGARESYIVTEFIHGVTLRQWMDSEWKPRPVLAAVVVHRLCQALGHAHRSGIIHRDIKPENVMIRSSDGCLKLMDFGIAQILDNQKLTMTGQLLGSPAYMAPELISGKPVDGRSDMFSVGILLYQLSTGCLPFFGRNPHEVLNRIADGEYPSPSSVNPLCDDDIEEIIRKALSNNPDERYQTADSLALELEAYLEEIGITPSGDEITAYFRDPELYVETLDQRVCDALMQRAHTSMRDGHSSRAIKLLGRVIEFDPEHKHARALLVRLRARARRSRQLLVGGAALAAVGLVGAGAVLLEEPEPIALDDAAAVDVLPPSDVRTSVTNTTEPDKNRVSAVTPSEAKHAKRIAAKPLTLSGGRCTLRITDVPATMLRNLEIKLGDGPSVPVTAPEIPVSMPLHVTELAFEVKSDRYSGRDKISAAACRRGEVISFSPLFRPAKLVFRGGPEPLAVKCLRGCPNELLGKAHIATHYPVITMSTGELTVELEFSHPEYKPATLKQVIYPGRNDITVALSPHPR